MQRGSLHHNRDLLRPNMLALTQQAVPPKIFLLEAQSGLKTSYCNFATHLLFTIQIHKHVSTRVSKRQGLRLKRKRGAFSSHINSIMASLSSNGWLVAADDCQNQADSTHNVFALPNNSSCNLIAITICQR